MRLNVQSLAEMAPVSRLLGNTDEHDCLSIKVKQNRTDSIGFHLVLFGPFSFAMKALTFKVHFPPLNRSCVLTICTLFVV